MRLLPCVPCGHGGQARPDKVLGESQAGRRKAFSQQSPVKGQWLWLEVYGYLRAMHVLGLGSAGMGEAHSPCLWAAEGEAESGVQLTPRELQMSLGMSCVDVLRPCGWGLVPQGPPHASRSGTDAGQ